MRVRGGAWKNIQNGLLLVRIQRFDEFNRVIDCHSRDGVGHLGSPELIDDLFGDCTVEFCQYPRIETLTQDFDHAFPLFGRNALEEIRDVGGVQRSQQLPRCVRWIGIERVHDFRKHGGMKIA